MVTAIRRVWTGVVDDSATARLAIIGMPLHRIVHGCPEKPRSHRIAQKIRELHCIVHRSMMS